jgi:hypothetical protein
MIRLCEDVPVAVSRQDESAEAAGGWGPVVTGCVALAVAAGGWVATGATSGVLRIVCGLLTLVAGGYAVYLFGLLLMFVVVRRFFERGGPEGVSGRIPWSVWVLTPTLVVSWALWAWLAGYDSEQWLWTGISVAMTSVVIVLAFIRPRRDAGS